MTLSRPGRAGGRGRLLVALIVWLVSLPIPSMRLVHEIETDTRPISPVNLEEV